MRKRGTGEGASAESRQAWQAAVLEALMQGGPVCQNAAQYIREHHVEIGFARQKTAARWTLGGHLELNPTLYALDTAPADPGLLGSIVHEAAHLEQGPSLALSVAGERGGWKAEYDARAELNAPIRDPYWQAMALSPDSPTKRHLRQVRSDMLRMAGWRYLVWLLPLRPAWWTRLISAILRILPHASRFAHRFCALWQRLDVPGLFLVAASLTVYVRTLAPTVWASDEGELQFKSYTMQLIHPSGYPLSVLLGKLWLILVPFGSVAYRVNLFSAVQTAAAVWFLYQFLRLLVKTRTAALTGAGLFAFSPLVWNYAIVPRVYTLNTLLFTALLYVWLRAYDQKCSFLWVAFVFGLGLAHHRNIVVIAPALLLATLIARKQMLPSRRVWLLAVPVMLLPLSLYGVLILQGAWPLPVLLRHVLIGNEMVHFLPSVGATWGRLVQTVWPWLSREIGWPLTLAGIGALTAFLWRPLGARDFTRQRCVGLLLAGLLLSRVAFFSLMWIEPDEPRYYMTATALIAAGVSVAVAYVQAGLRRWRKGAAQVALVALVAPAILAYRHFPEMDRRYDDHFERLGREAFQTVEQDAIIVASWPYMTPLRYFQAVEGWRPDVQTFMPDGEVNREQAVAWIEAGCPVYFREGTFGLDWPESGFAWINLTVGGLARALLELPPVVHWIPVSGVPPLQTVGLSAWPLQPDTLVRVHTVLETEPLSSTTKLSVRLADGRRQVWGEWMADFGLLRPVQVSDTLQVDLLFVTPPAIPPGEYTLELSLLQDDALLAATTIAGIPLAAREQPLRSERLVVGDWIAAPETLPHTLRLLAVTWPGRRFSENTLINLPLFWQTMSDGAPARLSLYLVSHGQRRLWVGPDPLLEGALAGPLPVGTLLESRHALGFADIAPGHYQVEAEVETEAGKDVYDLGDITVEAHRRVYRVPSMSHRLRATLGGEIELLGYDLQSKQGQSGEELTLTLYWRPLTRPIGNYKVFTHLMNGQGELVTQRDDLPLGGLVLTSQWSPREVLTDRYSIPLPTDLPEGMVQLEVGMYRPDSGERLVTTDADGNRWPNDIIVLQQVEIGQ